MCNAHVCVHILAYMFHNHTAESICAVGYGVCALFSAMNGPNWCFRNYCLTAVSGNYCQCSSRDYTDVTQPSLAEVVHREDFSLLPVIPADFIREHHGVYSGELCAVYTVILASHDQCPQIVKATQYTL